MSQQRFDSEGGPAFGVQSVVTRDVCMIQPGLRMWGIGVDAVSSVWASLRRKMVRGEGFEPPTNSV